MMSRLLGILMITAFGLSAAQADNVAIDQPVAVHPVVEGKPHHPSSSVRGRKKREMTTEQFKKMKEEKLTKLESFEKTVSALEAKVPEEDKKLFKLHLEFAKRWMDAIKGYESTETKLWRSIKFSADELKAAQALAALKPTHKASKAVYPEKDIEKLEARFHEIKDHAKDLTGDNLAAFRVMLDCAEDYINALKDMKSNPALARRMLGRAMKYVNTAQTFAVNRDSHH